MTHGVRVDHGADVVTVGHVPSDIPLPREGNNVDSRCIRAMEREQLGQDQSLDLRTICTNASLHGS